MKNLNQNNDNLTPQDNKVLSNGRSIEKQILVVFLKTLCIVLAVLIIAILSICLFAPKFASNISNELGMKKVSLTLSHSLRR